MHMYLLLTLHSSSFDTQESPTCCEAYKFPSAPSPFGQVFACRELLLPRSYARRLSSLGRAAGLHVGREYPLFPKEAKVHAELVPGVFATGLLLCTIICVLS